MSISVDQFSMDDIKRSKISYYHDDSDSAVDNFTFVVSDGISNKFIYAENGLNVTTTKPIVFPINIVPIDDSIPFLVKNEDLRTLKLENGKWRNSISEDHLFTEDLDTKEKDIIYSVTIRPNLGYLQLTSRPNEKVSHFTQKDINDGKLQYVLDDDDFLQTEDKFMFSVEDTKPNKLMNNIFRIQWARVNFELSFHNASEMDGHLEVSVIRTGNSELDFTATCQISEVSLSANNNSGFIPVVNEVN
ncbi:Extracellular matrix protein FRAS1, partial [Stegodyphus mimosarum]